MDPAYLVITGGAGRGSWYEGLQGSIFRVAGEIQIHGRTYYSVHFRDESGAILYLRLVSKFNAVAVSAEFKPYLLFLSSIFSKTVI